jgi:peptidoglycan DL-endopeptidase RipA
MALHVTTAPRTASRVAGTLLAAGLAVGLLAGPAAAPAAAAPGDAAIAEARQRADALTARMGVLAGRIEEAQATADAARAAAAIALDTFQATQEELRAAQSRATAAAEASAEARAALRQARGDVVDFARRSYMDGSSYPGAAALVTARSAAELVERAALLEAAGSHRSDVLVEVTVLQQQAERSERRAAVALGEARTLEEQAASALAQASAAEAAARRRAQEAAEAAGRPANIPGTDTPAGPRLVPGANWPVPDAVDEDASRRPDAVPGDADAADKKLGARVAKFLNRKDAE